jgi:imidazolonepropionase-like amidohydrolase
LWDTGILGYWDTGILGYWDTGILGYNIHGRVLQYLLSIMKYFLSGVMGGSGDGSTTEFGVQMKSQDYRTIVRQIITSVQPNATIIDPLQLGEEYSSLLYPKGTPESSFWESDSDVQQMFSYAVKAAENVDVVVCYLPTASMGSAVELHCAFKKGCQIICICPGGKMSTNWVVRSYADQVFNSMEEFASGLPSIVLNSTTTTTAAATTTTTTTTTTTANNNIEVDLPFNTLCLISSKWVRAKLFVNLDTQTIVNIEILEEAPDITTGRHFCIPGLIDTHVHLTACTANLSALTRMVPSYVHLSAANELRSTVRRGFTTVRDAGGADSGLSDASDNGMIMKPRCTRVLYVGHAISETGGHGDMREKGEDHHHSTSHTCGCCASIARGIGVVADGVDECRKVCRDELRKGAHAIKIMASGGVASPTDKLTDLQFSNDEIVAFVDEATRKNKYVMAHAYSSEAIIRAVQLGVKSIEHGNYLNEDAAKLMYQLNASLSQTIITYVALREDGEHYGMPKKLVEKVGNLVDAGIHSIQVAKKENVNITYGSDLLGGMRSRQLDGFQYLLDAGLTTREALQTANENAAQLLGINAGVIKVGSLADLVVLNCNILMENEMRNWCSDNILRVYIGGERVI